MQTVHQLMEWSPDVRGIPACFQTESFTFLPTSKEFKCFWTRSGQPISLYYAPRHWMWRGVYLSLCSHPAVSREFPKWENSLKRCPTVRKNIFLLVLPRPRNKHMNDMHRHNIYIYTHTHTGDAVRTLIHNEVSQHQRWVKLQLTVNQ